MPSKDAQGNALALCRKCLCSPMIWILAQFISKYRVHNQFVQRSIQLRVLTSEIWSAVAR